MKSASCLLEDRKWTDMSTMYAGSGATACLLARSPRAKPRNKPAMNVMRSGDWRRRVRPKRMGCGSYIVNYRSVALKAPRSGLDCVNLGSGLLHG